MGCIKKRKKKPDRRKLRNMQFHILEQVTNATTKLFTRKYSFHRDFNNFL